jgi:hypothetical protein
MFPNDQVEDIQFQSNKRHNMLSEVASFWAQTSLQNGETFRFTVHVQSLTSLQNLAQPVTEKLLI